MLPLKAEPPTAPNMHIGIEFSGLTGLKQVIRIQGYRSLEDAASVPLVYAKVSSLALI